MHRYGEHISRPTLPQPAYKGVAIAWMATLKIPKIGLKKGWIEQASVSSDI